MIELDYIGGAWKVTVIYKDGRNAGRIKRYPNQGWQLTVKDMMPWESTFDNGKAGFMTNAKMFKSKQEAVAFAKDFFNGGEDD